MTNQFTEPQAIKLSIALSTIKEKLKTYENEYNPNISTEGDFEHVYKLRFKRDRTCLFISSTN